MPCPASCRSTSGRSFEWLSLRLVDTLIALPFLVFAVAVTALLGNGIPQAMFTVGILVSPLFYRVSRAAALTVSRSQYVEAALLSGASVGWVVRKHVWAKVLPPLSIALATTMGAGFVVVSSLTFLGIGVQPPAPTWGGVLASELQYLSYQPWAPLVPTVLIMVTVWAFNLLADAIRDVTGQAGRPRTPTRPLPGGLPCLTTSSCSCATSPSPTPPTAPTSCAASDLTLRRGAVLGIVGESGSGKTLTCRAVLGILPPGSRCPAARSTCWARTSPACPPGTGSACAAPRSRPCSRTPRPTSTRRSGWASRSPRSSA